MVAGSKDRGRPEAWSDGAGQRLHRVDDRFAAALDAQFALPPRAAAEAQLARPPKEAAPSVEAVGQFLNVRPDPVDFRDMIYQPSLVELKTWMIPGTPESLGIEVRDQGSEGSCTGQALAAVIDLQNILRWRDKAKVPQRVSARMLYESARLFDEHANDGLPGSSARGAIKGFFHRGVCGADLAPYFPGDLRWRLDVKRAKAARQVTLGTYFRLRHVLNDYHAALAEAKALMCTSMIHAGWEREAVRANGGTISSPQNDPRRVKLTGAHAFAIVGYTPDGFIVLNSWGPKWGGFTPDAGAQAGTPLPGMALWPYDEWCEHVLDTWVLRLQVPAAKISGFSGGYHMVRRPGAGVDDPLRGSVSPASIPTMEVAGHVVNVANGVFSAEPPYENDIRTFQETARFLRRNETEQQATDRYKHLLFYAHGGLNEVSGAAARAAALTPVFKRHGIYPVFFLWHTGLGETAADLMRRLFEGVASRAGGFTDYGDKLFESAARPLGEPIWREMKADAQRSFRVAPGQPGGDAWRATQLLANAAMARTVHPIRIHLVGHSAGAMLLGNLLARAQQDEAALAAAVASVSLFAPACTNAFFGEHFAGLAAAMQPDPGRFVIYNLGADAEAADSVVGLYRKSLLHLVSNAFEHERQAELTGLAIYQRDWPGVQYAIADAKAPGTARIASRATTHGDFDNDPRTMNHVLARVLGRRSITEKEGGFSKADLVGRGF